MALSTNLIDYASITAQSGVTDDVGVQPSDNCHTIVVYNTTADTGVLVGIVPTGTNLTAANSATIPGGGSLTLRIGTRVYRPCGPIGTGGNVRLRVEGIGGTPVLSFQYINSAQDTAP